MTGLENIMTLNYEQLEPIWLAGVIIGSIQLHRIFNNTFVKAVHGTKFFGWNGQSLIEKNPDYTNYTVSNTAHQTNINACLFTKERMPRF